MEGGGGRGRGVVVTKLNVEGSGVARSLLHFLFRGCAHREFLLAEPRWAELKRSQALNVSSYSCIYEMMKNIFNRL